ncbi:MAG: sigma-70 family RNA polymerase sigma factor [Cytophagales bacterium]|nr:sigma-70 family RNA polymerase sigma factor [Bernardetiaceae bacterium]MDW8204850.1 sigma-70 family RNA polymerase sigma factor [Cytophagales bacterium]
MKTVALTSANDSELIESFRNGNENAFSLLFNRYRRRIFAVIYAIVKDAETAEDLLQETMIKALDIIRSNRYNDEGKFLPWVVRIARNMAIDFFRKQKRYPNTRIQEGSVLYNTLKLSEASTETVRIQSETLHQLKNYIYLLPENQKEVLMMRHYMKMSFQEIADVTNVSINTALGRMRYALLNLRRAMEKNGVTAECLAA